ncbi:MAG TPA: hypothetical protein VMT00_05405 [Thermoanaerobaculia bacterium]|nr:hypothetical protein [Thermoanaerobaculia bacterium]
MPKSLFYSGVVSCGLIALLLLGATPAADRPLPASTASMEGVRAVLLPLTLLLAVVPACAILLRMASLLAARNLFASFFAVFSVASAGVAASLLAAARLRAAGIVATEAASTFVATVREMELAGTYLLGWFLALIFLVLRPYFRFQASPILAALVYIPMPLFFFWASSPLITPRFTFASLVALRAVMSLLFMATAVHALRHRHLFIEVTNLRELLDMRVDPTGARPPAMSLGRDVAFDS